MKFYLTTTKALWKEALPLLFVGLILFTTVTVLVSLMKGVESFFVQHLRVQDLIAVMQPAVAIVLPVSLPAAWLVSILLTVGRWSIENEIIALRACGIGIHQLLIPFLILAIPVTVLMVQLSLFSQPHALASRNSALFDLTSNMVQRAMQRGSLIENFQEMRGLTFYSREIDDALSLRHILLIDERNPDQPVTILAESGKLIEDRTARELAIELQQGEIHATFRDRPLYRLFTFKTMRFNLTEGMKLPFQQNHPTLFERDYHELRQEIAAMLAKKKSPHWQQLMLHKRLASPVLCLLLPLIGVPLAIGPTRRSNARSITIGILVILGYFLLMRAGDTAVQNQWLSPIVAAWGPNAVYLAAGAFLFSRKIATGS